MAHGEIQFKFTVAKC